MSKSTLTQFLWKLCLFTGFASVFGSVSDLKPPHIIKPDQPETRYYTRYSNVTLRCHAGGEPKPTYKWWKSGTLIREDDTATSVRFDATTGDLYIPHFTQQDEGIYKCEASTTSTNKQGNTITIISFSPPITLYQIHSRDDALNTVTILLIVAAVAISTTTVNVIIITIIIIIAAIAISAIIIMMINSQRMKRRTKYITITRNNLREITISNPVSIDADKDMPTSSGCYSGVEENEDNLSEYEYEEPIGTNVYEAANGHIYDSVVEEDQENAAVKKQYEGKKSSYERTTCPWTIYPSNAPDPRKTSMCSSSTVYVAPSV